MRQQVTILMQKLKFPWTLQGNQLTRTKNEFILKLVKVSTFRHLFNYYCYIVYIRLEQVFNDNLKNCRKNVK